MRLGKEVDVSFTNTHTRKLLKHRRSVTGDLPEKASPTSLEDYIKKFLRLRESTPSGPSIVTPDIVKTEVTNPDLRELGLHTFNSPWCTGHPPKRYRRGIDLLIHKVPNSFRPHRLIPILLFNIEANLHNKNIGKITMKTAEDL